MAIVLMYRDKNDVSPVEQLITELVEKAAQNKTARIRLDAIRFCIAMLELKGLNIREPYAKKIEGQTDLYELRPRGDRIFYYSLIDENTFVLLHSFVKKSQKTPPKEIQKAVKERDDFIERVLKNGKK